MKKELEEERKAREEMEQRIKGELRDLDKGQLVIDEDRPVIDNYQWMPDSLRYFIWVV